MRVEVRVHPSAQRQAVAALRYAAPGRFRAEFARILEMLEGSPRIGMSCADLGEEYAHVRRVLMPKVRHYVFYVHAEAAGRVDVIAVWSNYRGGPPPLPR